MTRLKRPLIAFAALATIVSAQPRATRICPTVVGIYPTDFHFNWPLSLRPRFEVRACGDPGDTVQLLGFKARMSGPSMIEVANHIELLIQTGTVLVMQTSAGDSDPTFVAQFQKGNPVLLKLEDGVGGVTYAEEHGKDGDYAIITVPQKTFPGATGKSPDKPPHRYRLRIFQ